MPPAPCSLLITLLPLLFLLLLLVSYYGHCNFVALHVRLRAGVPPPVLNSNLIWGRSSGFGGTGLKLLQPKVRMRYAD